MGKDILSMLPQEIESDLIALGEQKFRAGQIFQWLSRGVRDFEPISRRPLGKNLRTIMSSIVRRS